jgi:hypothetical protein
MNEITKQQLLAILGEEANIEIEIDQKLYPRPSWAVNQIVRSNGLVEDICEHGIGHPNTGFLKLHDPNGELGYACHGCDLCCVDEKTKQRIRKEIKESND